MPSEDKLTQLLSRLEKLMDRQDLLANQIRDLKKDLGMRLHEMLLLVGRQHEIRQVLLDLQGGQDFSL